MATHTDKYKCKDDRFGCEYFYDVCQTVSDYHTIYNERLEQIIQYCEYNDYPEPWGYDEKTWDKITDFMDYLESCEKIDMDWDEMMKVENNHKNK